MSDSDRYQFYQVMKAWPHFHGGSTHDILFRLIICAKANIVRRMMNAQQLFDILSDETRRRLLGLLLKEGELCVCELHYALDMPQPKISRHLAAMRDIDLLFVTRDGTRIYYRLNTQIPLWAYRVLDAMVEAGDQPTLIRQDQQRLTRMTSRPERVAA